MNNIKIPLEILIKTDTDHDVVIKKINVQLKLLGKNLFAMTSRSVATSFFVYCVFVKTWYLILLYIVFRPNLVLSWRICRRIRMTDNTSNR